jgi:cellulose synthase/poly-beta-1,6-N-acetylglucosamine synthase-like glycosyltransferase
MFFYIWFFLGLTCLGMPAIYFAYMAKSARKPWHLKTDPTYQPSVSIVVPTYNEGSVIQHKLQNLNRLDYPKHLIQLIIVDSASADDTSRKIEEFKQQNREVSFLLIEEKERKGKSAALNTALENANGDIIIVSDADCFWASDILKKALPYLADQNVGGVAGQERLLNPEQSWVTKTEFAYRENMFKIQLGESKLSSTVQFEGGFGAYKRKTLDEFDTETGSDDSGTALKLVQKGFRTIVLDEAVFYTFFPPTWRGKIKIKTRRARQFFSIYQKCFKLMINRKLMLPKRVFLPQAFFLLLNPFIFLSFVCLSILVLFQVPFLTIFPLALFAFPKTRVLLVELFQNNFIALLALFEIATGKKSIIWNKAEDSRQNFNVDTLRSHGLID